MKLSTVTFILKILTFLLCVSLSCVHGQFLFDFSPTEPCENPCEDSPCQNNSTCIQDITCKPLCLCSRQYTGPTCQYEIDNVSSSVTAPPSDTIIRMGDSFCEEVGVFCKHGNCYMYEDAKFRCNCLGGWVGVHCNISLTNITKTDTSSISSETKTLPFGFSTKTFASSTTSNAEHLQFRLEAWNNLKPFTVPTETTTQNPANTPKVETRSQNSPYNVCSDTPMQRPLSERKCPLQAEEQACEYGVCREELVDHGSWMGHSFTCVCDLGARGNSL